VLHTRNRRKSHAGPPPPPELFQALQRKGITPLSRPSAWRHGSPPHNDVLETIRDLGLEIQVIFNKVPRSWCCPGHQQGTGLQAALEDLGLSPHNCAAIGDAENDQAFPASASALWRSPTR
jgi:hypothetical protein